LQANLIKNILWITIAFIVAIAFQIPMLWHGEYTFLVYNMMLIVLTIIYIRNFFDFESLNFHYKKWWKYGIFMLNILLFIFFLNRAEILLGHVDSMAIDKLIISKEYLSMEESSKLLKYINTEYLLFTISTFVAIAVYNIKILASFWKRTKIKRERKIQL